MTLSKEKMRDIYTKMCLAREFEWCVARMFREGQMHGTTHLGVGQEGSAVGVVSALCEEDIVFGSHRGHNLCIAKGMDVKAMMAEMLGKETGCCKGLGGSMHMADIKRGNYGTNGVVAGSVPIAAGVALAFQKERKPYIAVSFFGDGATNEGVFHETLNMAALWKLPVLFVCENNFYGMSTPVEKSTAVPEIAKRAAAYGMPAVTVDGNDVLEVMTATQKAAKRARQGGGPTLIEVVTYRWLGHSKSDNSEKRRYRSRQEEDAWKQRCPIKKFQEYLCQNGFGEDDFLEMEKAVKREVQQAVKFAQESKEYSLSGAEKLVCAD